MTRKQRERRGGEPLVPLAWPPNSTGGEHSTLCDVQDHMNTSYRSLLLFSSHTSPSQDKDQILDVKGQIPNWRTYIIEEDCEDLELSSFVIGFLYFYTSVSTFSCLYMYHVQMSPKLIWSFILFYFICFGDKFHYVSQAGFKLKLILLPQF